MFRLYRGVYPKATGNIGDDFRTIPISFCHMGCPTIFFLRHIQDDKFTSSIPSRSGSSGYTHCAQHAYHPRCHCFDRAAPQLVHTVFHSADRNMGGRQHLKFQKRQMPKFSLKMQQDLILRLPTFIWIVDHTLCLTIWHDIGFDDRNIATFSDMTRCRICNHRMSCHMTQRFCDIVSNHSTSCFLPSISDTISGTMLCYMTRFWSILCDFVYDIACDKEWFLSFQIHFLGPKLILQKHIHTTTRGPTAYWHWYYARFLSLLSYNARSHSLTMHFTHETMD